MFWDGDWSLGTGGITFSYKKNKEELKIRKINLERARKHSEECDCRYIRGSGGKMAGKWKEERKNSVEGNIGKILGWGGHSQV